MSVLLYAEIESVSPQIVVFVVVVSASCKVMIPLYVAAQCDLALRRACPENIKGLLERKKMRPPVIEGRGREKEGSFITVADVVRWRWGVVLAARTIATVKSVGRSEGQAGAAGSLYFFSTL